MSVQALGWAIEQAEVPARPALVLQALANHCNHADGGRCYPGIDTIAREARCSRRAVFGYLAALERSGYIEIIRTRKKSGRQGVNNYFLLFDRQPAPWHYTTPEPDPEPPIAAGDAEAVEAIEAENPPDIDSRVQTPHPENPPPECKASAPGQSATVCTRHIMPEPEDSITLESGASRAREPLRVGVPPGYRRQARTEIAAAAAATEEEKPKPIFVWEGSEAWKSHVRNGHKPGLTTVHEGRRGWWFRTLYPPKPAAAATSTGPPVAPESLMTEADCAALAREIG